MFSQSVKQLAPNYHARLLAELEVKGFAANAKLQSFMTAIKNHRYRFALQQLFVLNDDHADLISLLLSYHPPLDFKLNEVSQTGKTVLDCLYHSKIEKSYKIALIKVLKKFGAKYNIEISIVGRYGDVYFPSKYVDLNLEETLPKKMHVLWVGSDLTRRIGRLHKLAAKCHEKQFELNVWLESEAQLMRPLCQIAMSFPNIKIRLVNELCDQFKKLCTSDGYTLLITAIRREMVGSANFATASDFMRIMILILHGGIWFDMDVIIPSYINSSEEKKMKLDEERKKVAEKANDPEMKKNLENWFGIKAVLIRQDKGVNVYNTYILFGIPRHFMLFEILQHMVNEYWKLDKFDLDTTPPINAMDAKRLCPKSEKKFDDNSSRRALTIQLGPSIFMKFMNKYSEKMGEEFTRKSSLQKYAKEGELNGEEYREEFVYVPFFGVVDNFGDVSWDVRPPTSYESEMKSRMVPF